jgi:hypothetical protein
MPGLNDTSARDFSEPITAPAPGGPITRPAKPMPVWLRLRWEDGTERTLKGFAMGWTGGLVLVQYLADGEYHPVAKALWTEAIWVRRRAVKSNEIR